MVAAFINQSFGDMGLISWQGNFLMAMSVVCVGKLAIRVKAWPDPRQAALLRLRQAALRPGTPDIKKASA